MSYATVPTCRECPYFNSYGANERGRGTCQIFDRVEREHHVMTSDCRNHIKSEPEKIKVQPVAKKIRKPFPWVSFRNIISVAISVPLVVVPSPKAVAIPQPADPICHRGSGRFAPAPDKAEALLDDDARFQFIEGECDATTGNPPQNPGNSYYMMGFDSAKHQLSSGHIAWRWEEHEFEPVGEYEF